MNKVVLIGRIATDLEMAYTKGGEPALKFNLAVRETAEKTFFIPCRSYSKTATLIDTYHKKGDLIAVSGSIAVEEYQKDGQKRTFTSVVVREIDFVKGNTNNENQKQVHATHNVPSYSTYSDDDSTSQIIDIDADDLPF